MVLIRGRRDYRCLLIALLICGLVFAFRHIVVQSSNKVITTHSPWLFNASHVAPRNLTNKRKGNHVPPEASPNPELANGTAFNERLMAIIEKINSEQKVYNLDMYGPLNETTHVIIIQVHTRINYLKVLVNQLSKNHGIANALLIFSHDVFIPTANDYIRGIQFARVMQIFYPFSIQLYPTDFPGGKDPVDKNILKTSKTIRIPTRSQMKLHWWWKMNFVFGHIKILENFPGLISFTEEDMYFTENALEMLNLMKDLMARNQCGGCEGLSMAEDLRIYKRGHQKGENVLLSSIPTPWHLAFNRTLWNTLKKCSKLFCNYNDYNYDWTLRYVVSSLECADKPIKFLNLLRPRIFHTGDCGYHKTLSHCDPNKFASNAMKRSAGYATSFPKQLGKLIIDGPTRAVGPWGSFADPRDRWLCVAIANGRNNSNVQ